MQRRKDLIFSKLRMLKIRLTQNSERSDAAVAGPKQSHTGPIGREPNIQTATNKTDLTARLTTDNR